MALRQISIRRMFEIISFALFENVFFYRQMYFERFINAHILEQINVSSKVGRSFFSKNAS